MTEEKLSKEVKNIIKQVLVNSKSNTCSALPFLFWDWRLSGDERRPRGKFFNNQMGRYADK